MLQSAEVAAGPAVDDRDSDQKLAVRRPLVQRRLVANGVCKSTEPYLRFTIASYIWIAYER